MERYAQRHKETCSNCAKEGGEIVNTKNKPIVVNSPNELWVCDLIGRIQGQTSCNKFIFMAIDHYTKWIETRVLKNKTAAAVSEAIEDLIIKKHGIPNRILSDNGLEFKNAEIDKLLIKYGIEWSYNSPGQHETVGAVERVNKTFMEKLRKLSSFGELKWEMFVEQATEAVNLSFNRSIQTSPYIMKYGKIPMLKIDFRRGEQEITISKVETKSNRDQAIHKYYEKDITKGKVTANPKVRVGDHVLIYKEKLEQNGY